MIGRYHSPHTASAHTDRTRDVWPPILSGSSSYPNFLDAVQMLEKTNPNFQLVCTMTEMSKSKREWKGKPTLRELRSPCPVVPTGS